MPSPARAYVSPILMIFIVLVPPGWPIGSPTVSTIRSPGLHRAGVHQLFLRQPQQRLAVVARRIAA